MGGVVLLDLVVDAGAAAVAAVAAVLSTADDVVGIATGSILAAGDRVLMATMYSFQADPLSAALALALVLVDVWAPRRQLGRTLMKLA